MIPLLTDDSLTKPRLRRDISLFNAMDLPDFSTGPKADSTLEQQLAAIKEAGYEGVQAADPAVARRFGLPSTGFNVVHDLGAMRRLCDEQKDAGFQCATIHMGHGREDEDAAARLTEDVLKASSDTGFPVFIETHRATLTQDIYRTMKLIEQFPEMRFNADYSHWYCGLEMTNGPWDEKMEFMAPLFERVKFMHGRIASSGSMQVDAGDGSEDFAIWNKHFRDMWKRSFAGFLRNAQPNEYIIFAPELLTSVINYARVFKNADGEFVEETDRWEQAKVLTRMAEECFAAAEKESAAS